MPVEQKRLEPAGFKGLKLAGFVVETTAGGATIIDGRRFRDKRALPEEIFKVAGGAYLKAIKGSGSVSQLIIKYLTQDED